jgi:hypothetical protein
MEGATQKIESRRSDLPNRIGKSDLPICTGKNKELAGANLGAVLHITQPTERGNG